MTRLLVPAALLVALLGCDPEATGFPEDTGDTTSSPTNSGCPAGMVADPDAFANITTMTLDGIVVPVSIDPTLSLTDGPSVCVSTAGLSQRVLLTDGGGAQVGTMTLYAAQTGVMSVTDTATVTLEIRLTPEAYGGTTDLVVYAGSWSAGQVTVADDSRVAFALANGSGLTDDGSVMTLAFSVSAKR